ncbi:hypothetical protein [Ursidibacter sp. B-7004-1]
MKTINLAQRKHSLEFDLNRSIRYNSKRSAFFRWWDNLTNITNALLGSASAVAILNQAPQLAVILGFSVTLLSVLAFWLAFSQKANQHQNFVLAFGQLRNQLLETDLTHDKLNQIEKAMHRLDDEEGEPLKNLEKIAYNETVIALGYSPSDCLPLKWYQRLFAHYW